LEILSARLNELKGLINDTQQPLPSPSLSCSEHQRLWNKELEQELRMKREEKRKQLAKQGSPMSPPNSKGLQRPASRLATPWMQRSSPAFVQVKQSCSQSILINKILTSFSIPTKVVQLLNYLATCSFYNNKYMQKTNKTKTNYKS
jgi:hypothetical protein